MKSGETGVQIACSQFEEIDMRGVVRYCLLGVVVLVALNRSQAIAQVVEAREPGDVIFEVKPRVIMAGETAVLHWSIKGATKVLIEEAPKSTRRLRKIGTFGGTGGVEVRPTERTTYVISCQGPTTGSCLSFAVRIRVKPR